MNQIIDHLTASIRDAAAHGTPLRIVGGGTKDFYGGPPRGNTLTTGAYRGILEYDPTELVMTARAGTPLAEIEAVLREKRQMLAFEPPHFGATTTLGGCVAAGLSGPRRACAGAVRDFVLGVRMLDGNGTDLRFGGRVMKNVAGYDVSRLMAGSLGTLGVVLEVSLKVLPLPAAEVTLNLKCSEAEALARMNEWAAKPLPVSATAYRDGNLGVRLSGAAAAVDAAIADLGGTLVESAQAERYWRGIREQTDAYFSDPQPLWRLSVKSTAPSLDLRGSQFIEWRGALRWLKTDAAAQSIREAAARAGGHATLFRGGDKTAGVFQPLSAPLMKIHQRLKQSFDPTGIFNPGRMYPEF